MIRRKQCMDELGWKFLMFTHCHHKYSWLTVGGSDCFTHSAHRMTWHWLSIHHNRLITIHSPSFLLLPAELFNHYWSTAQRFVSAISLIFSFLLFFSAHAVINSQNIAFRNDADCFTLLWLLRLSLHILRIRFRHCTSHRTQASSSTADVNQQCANVAEKSTFISKRHSSAPSINYRFSICIVGWWLVMLRWWWWCAHDELLMSIHTAHNLIAINMRSNVIQNTIELLEKYLRTALQYRKAKKKNSVWQMMSKNRSNFFGYSSLLLLLFFTTVWNGFRCATIHAHHIWMCMLYVCVCDMPLLFLLCLRVVVVVGAFFIDAAANDVK